MAAAHGGHWAVHSAVLQLRIVRVISLGLKAMSEASQFQVRLRAVSDTLHAAGLEFQGMLRGLEAMSDALQFR